MPSSDNTFRVGDVVLQIDGEDRILRLTLGALAEIEEAFGGDLALLSERMARPSAGDLLRIVKALLKGGGAPMSTAAIDGADIDLAAAAAAVAKCFSAAFPGEALEKKSVGEGMGVRRSLSPTRPDGRPFPGGLGLRPASPVGFGRRICGGPRSSKSDG